MKISRSSKFCWYYFSIWGSKVIRLFINWPDRELFVLLVITGIILSKCLSLFLSVLLFITGFFLSKCLPLFLFLGKSRKKVRKIFSKKYLDDFRQLKINWDCSAQIGRYQVLSFEKEYWDFFEENSYDGDGRKSQYLGS